MGQKHSFLKRGLVAADDQVETVEKLTYDLFYIKHSSFWLDLQILGKSVWTVMTGFGAR